MTTKIDQKIVGYKVVTKDDKQITPAPDAREKITESMKRPEMLIGSTYKIKPPIAEYALYITINDMLINAGTEYESRQPYEVFINSKNMEHFQWVLALTRVISAVFRKGGDITFLVYELKDIFDPKGGYFKKGGVYMPSLVAEIGHAIEHHMKLIGIIKAPEIDEHQKKFLAEKRKEFEAQKKDNTYESVGDGEFPEKAQLCTKCNVKALILMDGCLTCLNCGDSKCG